MRLTQDIRTTLSQLPKIGETDGRDSREIPTVKLFMPVGAATWYLAEYDPDSQRAYGWADLGLGPGCAELGYVYIPEVESVRVMGLGVEVDVHWRGSLSDGMAPAHRGVGE